jgi:hypothetical protein
MSAMGERMRRVMRESEQTREGKNDDEKNQSDD